MRRKENVEIKMNEDELKKLCCEDGRERQRREGRERKWRKKSNEGDYTKDYKGLKNSNRPSRS